MGTGELGVSPPANHRQAENLSNPEFSVVVHDLVSWLGVLFPNVSLNAQDKTSVVFYAQEPRVVWKQRADIRYPQQVVSIYNQRHAIKICVAPRSPSGAGAEAVIYGFRGRDGAPALEANDAPEPGFNFDSAKFLQKYRIGGQWYEFYSV